MIPSPQTSRFRFVIGVVYEATGAPDATNNPRIAVVVIIQH